MKTDLAFKDGSGRGWTGTARGIALVAAIGLGAAALGSGACSAAPGGHEFGSGGAGSTQGAGNGSQSGGSQSGGSQSGTLSGGVGGSNNTVGSGFVGTNVGGGSPGPSTGVGGACASSHFEGKQTPLDIYFMYDKSGSMLTNNKWTNCANAFKTFVQSPTADGIGVGIQYFPISGPVPPGCMGCTDCTCIFNCGCNSCTCSGNVCTCGSSTQSCQPTDYATPAVPIGLLPGNATALINSINSIAPNGGTPTRPALEGALSHARDWAIANPDHKVVTVLATDGIPSTSLCAPNTIPDSQALAAMYFNGTPSIPTYVIGVGTELVDLHAIAMSGGTMMAYIVDSGANTTQQFLDAMNAIRNSAGLACEYQIPAANDGGVIDFDKVNVQYIPGNGGPPVDILHAQSAADCDPVQGGWYYDNNAAPTKILICPATCTTIEADDMGQIDILFGCPTVNLPPH